MGEKEKLVQELEELAREKSISCPQALALANRLGLSPREVGQAADRLGIKITDCQLGCFGSGRKG